MPTDNFRTILCEQTREAHERIERVLGLDADVAIERYIAYLRAMHSVVASAEELLEHDARLCGFDPAMRPQRERLERDLRHFGVEPLSSPVPVPSDMAARVGWLYVLEGATLGARVLFKRLAPRLSLTPENGGAFVAGYGNPTPDRWRRFVIALDRAPFTPEEKKACIAGARQAFSAVEACFRASVAGADLHLAGQDRGLAAPGAPCDEPPAAAVQRAQPQHGEERLPER